ncbi:MAG: RNA polymerase sigma factor [Bacteroides sp.]|nr:RNA polymerase sigma factor [Bacteroides sp.]
MDNGDCELQIVKLLNQKDNQAARQIYDAYAGYLAGVCARYISDDDDLKDVLQDSFIKIFSSLASFKYKGKGSLKAWLARIVANQSLNFLKEKGRLKFVPITNQTDEIESPGVDIGIIPESVLLQMIRELPSGYRVVFNLRVYEEKSHKEIAKMLDIRVNSSASQFLRAKALLAEKIREYINQEISTSHGR